MRDYGTNHEGLYDALVHKCESHLDDVYIEACSMPLGLPLLEFYVDAWSTFQNTLKRCSILFSKEKKKEGGRGKGRKEGEG